MSRAASVLISAPVRIALCGLLLVAAVNSLRTQEGDQKVDSVVAAAQNEQDLHQPVHVPLIAPFHYPDMGRRDPFIPLVSSGKDQGIPSITSLTLSGVIWDARESLALLEDAEGQGYPMRVGDRLGSATLVGIREDAAIFRIVIYGEVHMHTLKLEPNEEM
jgi:hypothetical protein